MGFVTLELLFVKQQLPAAMNRVRRTSHAPSMQPDDSLRRQVKPKPQDKLLVPFILLTLAARPVDYDHGDNAFGKDALTSNSLGVIGFIIGTAAGQRNIAAGIAAQPSRSMSAGSNVVAKSHSLAIRASCSRPGLATRFSFTRCGPTALNHSNTSSRMHEKDSFLNSIKLQATLTARQLMLIRGGTFHRPEFRSGHLGALSLGVISRKLLTTEMTIRSLREPCTSPRATIHPDDTSALIYCVAPADSILRNLSEASH